MFLTNTRCPNHFLGDSTSYVTIECDLRCAISVPAFLKETGGIAGPTLIKSLVDTELWQLAKMDEVVSYLAGSKYLCLPDIYNEAFTD